MFKGQFKTILVTLLCLAPGPHASAAGEENIGRVQSPLVSPTVVPATEQEQLGLLATVSNRGGCTASLLTNDWAVSASHCFNAMDMRNPAGVRVTAAWLIPQAATPDYIYRFWGVDAQGSTYDIALIHLNAPMRVNGSTTGYVRELSEFSLQDMDTQNIAVYGRGINVLARNTPAGPMSTSGDGLMRSAVFTVNRIERTLFWYPKGGGGETVGSGDSGGPSFEMSHGTPRIAGVHALCHTQCLAGQSCPESNPWQWVSEIDECADAPVGYLRGTLGEIMKQTWDPTRAVQSVMVSHSEGNVQKEMLLGQIDNLPWDYVRRAAQLMCVNRGFVSGYLDGNGQPGSRYQLRCFGAAAGSWHDAGPPEMSKISEKFRNIRDTGWALGARGANELCKVIQPASVGGILTGYQIVTAPDAPFYDQKDGVFCFNDSNARWFDATQAELAAQGTPIGDLNNTGWAVAGRAATAYCRKKFYPAGGFFNGHQLNDKRGIVCLGPNSLVTDRVNAEAGASIASAAKKPARISASRTAIVGSSATRVVDTAPSPTPPVPAPSAAPMVTVFYAINADGSVSEYRHDQPETGTAPQRFAPTSSGWRSHTDVAPAGGNRFFARARNGDLLWYQHDGVNDGADAWSGPTKVGNGWQTAKQLIGGGDGVIYAIAPDGVLTWYRHAGTAGDPRAWLGPKQVGNGWQSFKQVFSAGKGAIYAITQDGKLMLYRHLDPQNGEARWSGPTQVGTGWNGFAQVFSTGNGVIYALAPDGKLSYYRHLTWNAAQPTFQWVGPVAVGGTFDAARKLIPVLE